MMFQFQRCSAQTCCKSICNETSVGIAQRHYVDTTAARRWCFNRSAYFHDAPNIPKLRSGHRLRHDQRNFDHDQIRSGYELQDRLEASGPPWRYLGNSFNERLRQRRSCTILLCGHCLCQFHGKRKRKMTAQWWRRAQLRVAARCRQRFQPCRSLACNWPRRKAPEMSEHANYARNCTRGRAKDWSNKSMSLWRSASSNVWAKNDVSSVVIFSHGLSFSREHTFFMVLMYVL